jgi:hypothetical protein
MTTATIARRPEHRNNENLLGVTTLRVPGPSKRHATLTYVLFATGPREEGRYVAHVAALASPSWVINHGVVVPFAVASILFDDLERERYQEPR